MVVVCSIVRHRPERKLRETDKLCADMNQGSVAFQVWVPHGSNTSKPARFYTCSENNPFSVP